MGYLENDLAFDRLSASVEFVAVDYLSALISGSGHHPARWKGWEEGGRTRLLLALACSSLPTHSFRYPGNTGGCYTLTRTTVTHTC